jgi:hypothetical protein
MLLVHLLLACAGRDHADVVDTDTASSDCDPSVPSIDLPDFRSDAGLTNVVLRPTDIDPESDNYAGSNHSLWVSSDPAVARRDELLVMLPGTRNTPDGFDEVAKIAARAGYPVIVLAWDSELHPSELCTFDPDDVEGYIACRTAVVEEKAYGVDASPHVDIGEADGVVGRLERLLAHLAANYPETGADAFLEGTAPRWSSIALAGFSQGAMMSGYLSRAEEMARLVLFAGGCEGLVAEDGTVYLADWCTVDRATPADRTRALYHTDDQPEEFSAILDAYGVSALGDPVDAGRASPAYCADTHTLVFDLPDANGGAQSHLATAHDQYLPRDADGVPLLAEDIYWLFTAQ